MGLKISGRVDLRRSSEAVGHLYPVLKAADGEVLDGFHRKDSDPSWPERILENVRTREEKLLVKAHANMGRRFVSRKERVELVLTLAELYEEQGLQVRAPFTFTRKDPRLGVVEQVSYRNEIVDRISEVLDGCLHKGTIQAYLKGTRFMQEKGPQPEEKKTKTELHEIYRKKGPLHCLRRFYASEFREKFSRTFLKDLEAELEEKVKEKLTRDPEFRAEMKKRLWDEIREELDAFVQINRVRMAEYFEPELRRIRDGESLVDVVPHKNDRKILNKYGLLTQIWEEIGHLKGCESIVSDVGLEILDLLEEDRSTEPSDRALEILREGRI